MGTQMVMAMEEKEGIIKKSLAVYNQRASWWKLFFYLMNFIHV